MNERDWIFVEDFCRAVLTAIERGEAGQVYNVSAGEPRPNLTLIRTVLAQLGKPESLIQFVADRPGHDRRYALDSSKLRSLGWQPQVSFEDGIRCTIAWYTKNLEWLRHARSGEYRHYYDRHYSRRGELLKSLAGQG
jgi:dTDP-glucose 4,6-dehydratase